MSRLQFIWRIISKDILLRGFFRCKLHILVELQSQGEQRLTGALEGHPRGGGEQRAMRGGRTCGACREPEHTRPSCPNLRK